VSSQEEIEGEAPECDEIGSGIYVSHDGAIRAETTRWLAGMAATTGAAANHPGH
jgi:hypothetical protein